MSFEEFLNTWNQQFHDVTNIIRFLNTYPEIFKKLEINDLLDLNELEQSQKDWVRICTQYDGLEKQFFKPFWVPIQKSNLDYFIDLSDSNYPIFEIGFVFFQPYSYKRINLFNTVNELMYMVDSENDFESLANEFKQEWFSFFCTKIHEKKCY